MRRSAEPNSQVRTIPKRQLSLFDLMRIIVGIIIGAGICQMALDIAKGAHYWWPVPAIWLVGGLVPAYNTANKSSHTQDNIKAVPANTNVETDFMHKHDQGIGVTLKRR